MNIRILYSISVMFSLLSLLSGCSDNNDSYNENAEGNLHLNVTISSKVQVVTRSSLPTEQDLSDSALVRIYSDKGLIRRYKGLDNLPESLTVKSGVYSVKVESGDSVPASFDKVFYKAEQNFEVFSGKSVSVDVPCRIANTIATVEFSNISDEFQEYKAKLFNRRDTLFYTQVNASRDGYFMFAEERSLGWIFEGRLLNGDLFIKHGQIDNMKPTTRYNMTFSFNESGSQFGGSIVELEVDESEILVEEEVVYYRRPIIVGEGFDILTPQFFELNKGQDFLIKVSASSQLRNVVVSSDAFNGLGMPVNSYDLISSSDDETDFLAEKGITSAHIYNQNTGKSVFELTLSEDFVKLLTVAEGDYIINIEAIDSNDKQREAELSITATDAVVSTVANDLRDVFSYSARLYGKVLRDVTEELKFRYRIAGDQDWIEVPAELQGEFLSAQIHSLTDNTKYEYQAMHGEVASSVTAFFTTEEARMLPNGGFESWQASSAPYLLYASGESMFWDSGNHGSATMKVNVTTPDSEVLHSGNYSLKMQSQFVGIFGIGKFAAGNAFVGKYLATEGTNGVLSFGREFVSRPKKLKGYYRYITATVDYSEINEMPKGSKDIGIVYAALADWTPDQYNGQEVPFLVSTGSKKFFDKDDKAVIAYGQQEFTETSEGDGLHEFTIDLDYNDLNRRPVYLLIVASASKYGDYFTGGNSTLWLDDLEFIYE